MTQQYLAGELSLLLSQLQTAAGSPAAVGDVAGLRREAETLPVTALSSVVVRAMRLTDVLCWDSVTRGDIAAFNQQATACAELYEFGVCAGMLEED